MRTPGSRGPGMGRRRGASASRTAGGPRLGPATWRKLGKILVAGARSQGYPSDLWTLKRIAAVLRRELGDRYEPGHLGRLLDRLGWAG